MIASSARPQLPTKDLKEKGNEAFKSGDYPAAIGHYTAAILADRTDPTFPLNRAAAYLKLYKYEDAARDCSTVLASNASNVKALFRRGQAMVGLYRLSEAQKDFKQVLKLDPTNQSAQQEIKKVTELIDKEEPNLRGRHRPLIEVVEPTKSASTPPKSDTIPSATPPAPSPKRRRIPIEIVESTDEVPAILKSDNAQLAPVPSAPSSSSQATPLPPKDRTFKDAQQARAATKPTRTGGGIFRSTGNHSIFNVRGNESPDPPRPTSTNTPPPHAVKSSPSGGPWTGKAPTTLFDFTKAMTSLNSVEDRWNLICTIPPPNFPNLFKISLEPPILVLLLETFLATLGDQPQDKENKIREYMDALETVPRFSTVVLLLTKGEKDCARKVWERLGVDRVSSAWRL